MEEALITGGTGFAGAHICEHLLQHTDWRIIVLDRLAFPGTLSRLSHLRDAYGERIRFVFHDFRAEFPSDVVAKLAGVAYVIHNGAETHVERSIVNPRAFVEANVLGTMHVLECARKLPRLRHFIYVSTDEVHGPAAEGVDYTEDARIRPSNPYSATKAGGEALVAAWGKCYRLPVTITRTMNLFGERQHCEKFVPMTIRKVLAGDLVRVHGTADGRIGSRKWLHARNQANALMFLLRRVTGIFSGETFHIAGEERSNLDIARLIAAALNRTLEYEVVDYHAERPGHDLRYSLDDSKIRALGWTPPVPFEESLRRTVEWTRERPEWLA